jgi:hypothetical protein
LYKIKISQLKFSTVTKGKYQCLKKVSFSHSNSDKTCKLSLTNYNLRESGTGEKDTNIISDPHDHLCTVRLLKYHIQYNLPPNWKGFLFLRKASTEIIKLRKSLGITFCLTLTLPVQLKVPVLLEVKLEELSSLSKNGNLLVCANLVTLRCLLDNQLDVVVSVRWLVGV